MNAREACAMMFSLSRVGDPPLPSQGDISRLSIVV
jgi:hypothetical protein